ncbi:CKLF-like MARVEL transmembrane domain-containing protein 8b [Trichomycterus rosablanca]|uniref:CKLF-like MARVEL transmembrane domain-containing protein 8b n=1 Tax=Trichomycterus rosablanca TaxID=2290929 RepID=UPI002F34F1E9
MEEDSESRVVNTVHRGRGTFTLEELGLSHSALAYNKKFVCSMPCLLMFGEVVCGLLVWTLLGGTEFLRVPALGWVMFVSVICWVLTLCLLLLYLTTAYTKIPHVSWTALDLCFNSSATVLYTSAAVVNAASVLHAIRGRYYYTSWIASTVLAFLVVLCYAASTFLCYRSWKSKSDDA